MFIGINGYPKWIVYQTIETVRRRANNSLPDVKKQPDDNTDTNTTKFQISLPYQGEVGEIVTKKMKNYLNSNLPNTETRVTFKGSRLSSNFSIKDKIPDKHKHNIVYDGQ